MANVIAKRRTSLLGCALMVLVCVALGGIAGVLTRNFEARIDKRRPTFLVVTRASDDELLVTIYRDGQPILKETVLDCHGEDFEEFLIRLNREANPPIGKMLLADQTWPSDAYIYELCGVAFHIYVDKVLILP